MRKSNFVSECGEVKFEFVFQVSCVRRAVSDVVGQHNNLKGNTLVVDWRLEVGARRVFAGQALNSLK
jgi:hypothetical protein